MSFLSEELERQMTETLTSQVKLAELSNISQSQISKWISSNQTSINRDQLTALATALSKDPQRHAALISAHLHDEKFGPHHQLVRIEVDSPTVLKDKVAPKSRGDRAMVYLAEQRVTNKEVNDLVIDLARCLGAKL